MFFFGFADELTKLAQGPQRYRFSSPGSKVKFDAQGKPIFKRAPGPPPGWHATKPKPVPAPPIAQKSSKPKGFVGKIKSLFQ